MLSEIQNQDKLNTLHSNFSSSTLLWKWVLSPVRGWHLLNAYSPRLHRNSLIQKPNGKGNLSMELLKEDLYSVVNTSQLSYSSTLLLLLQLCLEKQLVIITLRHGPGFFFCVPFLPTLQRNKTLCGLKGWPLFMYEIFIIKFLLESSCKLLCLLHDSSLNWKVIWSCHLEMLLVYYHTWHRVFTSSMCGFMGWRKEQVRQSFRVTEQNLKNPLRPILLCPVLISDAFDSIAEEAWVYITGYLDQKAGFFFFLLIPCISLKAL